MPRLADELQYDEDHNLYICGGCVAYGACDADGDEWRRTCADCGDLLGAALVTGEEGDDKLCKLVPGRSRIRGDALPGGPQASREDRTRTGAVA